MQYKIVPIGAEFSKKAIHELGNMFTAESRAGYELHSVFIAQQTGCLGWGSMRTYFAIYVKKDREG